MNREYIISQFKSCYGANAKFREGQLEAIECAVQGERILVVQKTGWGKSLVYFLTTKLLREQGMGLTLIVSPLLVLMNNQIDAANKLGLNVRTINSQNSSDWNSIFDDIANNRLDALIISPERLANEEFRRNLAQIGDIGMLVIDEAHCISDWGHDFRPDYRRIVNIVKSMPKETPLIATTATANNRVVSDIKEQLGENLVEHRGNLMRNSLKIQTINIEQPVERLAWLKENVNKLPGTGIVYCLTIKDCEMVAKWLQLNGISCEAFYGQLDSDKKANIVERFMKNEIKVLSATVAFGMGFDKPDIGFVVHFQKPKDIVSYYQQIGRAGRAENQQADIILLYGAVDDEINEYFIESAFPSEKLMNDIINTLRRNPGISTSALEEYVNASNKNILGCLKYLAVEGAIYSQKDNGRGAVKYYPTVDNWQPDRETIAKVTSIRRKELEDMNTFANLNSCFMRFLAEALDDSNASDCGQCANCKHEDFYPQIVDQGTVSEAEMFLKEGFNIIEKRKKMPNNKNIPSEWMCEDGLVLSSYADSGWGRDVANGKYREGYFSDELVQASYNVLHDLILEQNITWITYIDSLRRPELVKSFAERLANELGLPCKKAICKIDVDCIEQKKCENSSHQYQNVENSFAIDTAQIIKNENVLLVDDMVDSKWTLTVCGMKLRANGCGKVFPFALASTAGRK